MRLSVNHITRYRYSEPTRRIIQLLRVTPSSFQGQTVLSWRIDVDCDARLREGRDGFGNVTHMLYVDQPVQALTLSVSGRVLTEDNAGIVRAVPGDLPHQVFLRETPLTAAGEALDWLAMDIADEGGARLDTLHGLNRRIYERMRFDVDATGVGTSAEDAFGAGHGVCQDFAHIFIAVARRLRIPARYISGHLFRRDGAHRQPAAHAWVEAFVDDLGWVAFDPTNGISTDDAYLRVACGFDYREAAPIVGARSGGGIEELAVEVAVHQARSQSQWQVQS
ncbi:transglutaminase family protein [Sphingosinicella sp. BN140058]|uniref:transglutaminase family protein n=1 Tax=Sphingosinicella sp. BN140058 TaxID=1892855 RepID=UPI001010A80E|nr:transglutaminase family protein [Sphingosinicella sp. BN140058]QAY77240.1 transglutaminase family protein [Sphingosinicella sp. BN140058]